MQSTTLCRDNGVIWKFTAYVILGINAEGKKKCLLLVLEKTKFPSSGFLF